MHEIISKLVEWDKELFLYLNGFHSGFLDAVMWFVSGKIEWIPLYFFLAYLLFKQFGKKIYIPLFFIALTITLTDQLSVMLFKNVFERLRPCHDPSIQELVHIVNDKCGGRYGFVSNHAANTFGIATLISLLLRESYKWLASCMFIWALIVSYSRIYLGVHFPADILAGAYFGCTVAILMYTFALVIGRINTSIEKKAGKV